MVACTDDVYILEYYEEGMVVFTSPIVFIRWFGL